MQFGKIGVVGLGYVGLPLAIAFSRKYEVVGFDISEERVRALKSGVDFTRVVTSDNLRRAQFGITDDVEHLRGCSILIVTVPTPVDDSCRPDFGPLRDACKLIGKILAPGAIVVFESTVYPGATEEVCAPVLEAASGLKSGEGFKLGYSPERINPGDEEHPLEKIVKIVSGQDTETLDTLAALYGSIIEAGVYRASSIKVAEAAKIIENTQRDLNVALMNELSKISDLLGIRSVDVLEAAGTKWNFLKFHPGLVGGHCIGVDPYYLTAKAEQLGYHPEVILAGRRINDGMGGYIAQRAVKLLSAQGRPLREARVGILGLTFKENVPDMRNSKVKNLCVELREFGMHPIIHDPLADKDAAREEFGIEPSGFECFSELDMLVYAVNHADYVALGSSAIQDMVTQNGIIIDVRCALQPSTLREDITYWSSKTWQSGKRKHVRWFIRD